MGEHLTKDGKFQSDKYPTTPAGKVPLSTRDPMAQDLLYTYAQRRRIVDPAFADDLETALRNDGYVVPWEADLARARAFRQEWLLREMLEVIRPVVEKMRLGSAPDFGSTPELTSPPNSPAKSEMDGRVWIPSGNITDLFDAKRGEVLASVVDRIDGDTKVFDAILPNAPQKTTFATLDQAKTWCEREAAR